MGKITMYLVIILAFFVSSCGDKKSPASIASDACSCATNNMMNMARDGNSLSDLDEDGCEKELIDRLVEILDPMSEDERAEFLNEVAIELIDTDCANLALTQLNDKQVLFYLNILEKLPVDSTRLK